MWKEICRISLTKLHFGKCLEDDVKRGEIFSFSFKQWFTFTCARNVKWLMPDLSRIITFQEMFERWHKAWWKIFSFSLLTHWGRDKMVAIFSWMRMYEFRLRFHWNLFLKIYFVREWMMYSICKLAANFVMCLAIWTLIFWKYDEHKPRSTFRDVFYMYKLCPNHSNQPVVLKTSFGVECPRFTELISVFRNRETAKRYW